MTRSWKPAAVRKSRVALLGWAVLVAGCAHGGPERIDPTASYPETPVSTLAGDPGTASLRVFTEPYLVGHPGDAEAPKKQFYSGYTVYDERGRRGVRARERGSTFSPAALAWAVPDPAGPAGEVRTHLSSDFSTGPSRRRPDFQSASTRKWTMSVIHEQGVGRGFPSGEWTPVFRRAGRSVEARREEPGKCRAHSRRKR